jgi:nitrogen fixation-related uncharacterized protein
MGRCAWENQAMSDLLILQIITAVMALAIGLGIYFWTEMNR